MEITSSHYIAFTAFVQLAVALNFGLVYLDRRSGLIQLKRKLFGSYRASNNVFVYGTGNILKRYRSNHNYPDKIELAHTKAKQYHTKVTADWNDEYEISFFPALGVVCGLYGLAVLYLVCFFDMLPERLAFYENHFLVLSQVTLVFSSLLTLRSWNKAKVTRIVPVSLLYVVVAVISWWFCSKGWTIRLDMAFAQHFHWYMLLTYLPIIYYLLRVAVVFLHKTMCLVPMLWWTFVFDTELNQKKR